MPIADALLCPISGELLNEPIVVPCCTKAFSRECLSRWLETNNICPLCRGNLDDFDADNAPKNLLLAGMVEEYVNENINHNPENVLNRPEGRDANKWTSKLTYIGNNKLAELELMIENATYSVKPCLFILVADNSGSMAGTAWNQVKDALHFITSRGRENPMVKVKLIVYNSSAQVIELKDNEIDDNITIGNLRAGGGTSFRSAFNMIHSVLKFYKCSDDDNTTTSGESTLRSAFNMIHNVLRTSDENSKINVSNVMIMFLTDGEDMSQNRLELAREFKTELAEKWNGPLSVHSLGFGSSHDRQFLEELWHSGSVPGSFRYAEPNEDGDMLCSKIQSIFDIATNSSVVPLVLKLNGLKDLSGNSEFEIKFNLNSRGEGKYNIWVKRDDVNDNDVKVCCINSMLETDRIVEISECQDADGKVRDKWILKQVDNLADELLKRVSGEKTDDEVKHKLLCYLFEEKIKQIELKTNNPGILSKLKYLLMENGKYMRNECVNMGKLADMRFSSIYSVFDADAENKKIKPSSSSNVQNSITNGDVNGTIKNEEEYKEVRRFYSHNNDGMDRSKFQEYLFNKSINWIDNNDKKMVDEITEDELKHKDRNGNGILHTLAYTGMSYIMEYFLEKWLSGTTGGTTGGTGEMNIDINEKNNDDETPLTLAIKARGFDKCVNHLIKFGARIPSERESSLKKYAIVDGYTRTAKLIVLYSGMKDEVDESMTETYIRILYEKDKKDGKITVNSDNKINIRYLEICLLKGMMNEVDELLNIYNTIPTLKMLINSGLPKKADSPDVDEYLTVCKKLVGKNPDLINETDENQEGILLHSCVSGNLPIVKYFIEIGSNIEKPNILGNTPLWISCAKRYPCIIEELINNGANVNHYNLKGNPPLYPICQKGPLKIAQTLLENGAIVEHNDETRDSLLLVACRHGQNDIVKLLLDYVSPNFVKFRPKIDGFSALFSSVEADQSSCVEVLYEYGVDLEEKTSIDNPIIKGSTALHLAAYYNRYTATKSLLALGANPNSVDIVLGQTPLHVAVIQGNKSIIELLLQYNADKSIKDKNGGLAVSYCRNSVDIQNIMIDKFTKFMNDLVDPECKKDKINEYFNAIRGCYIEDLVDPLRFLTKKDDSGLSMMRTAIIYGNYDVMKNLVDIGVELEKDDGIYLEWMGNPRMKSLFEEGFYFDKDELERLKKASNESVNDRMVLNMLVKPKRRIVDSMGSSGILNRMNDFSKIDDIYDCLSRKKVEVSNLIEDGNGFASVSPLDFVKNGGNINAGEIYKTEVENYVHENKMKVFEIIKDGWSKLSATEICLISAYSSGILMNRLLSSMLMNDNEPINTISPILSKLYDVMKHKTEPYVGEVYIGCSDVNRMKFREGIEFELPYFQSATTSWRIALELLPRFNSDKKKDGTIILIKSKSGRYISQYSRYAYEGEVVFLPKTKFRVRKWYIGDIIALGQENIRDHTYKLSDTDKNEYVHNHKPLIIELEEV